MTPARRLTGEFLGTALLLAAAAFGADPVFPYGAVYFRKSNPPEQDWARDHATAARPDPSSPALPVAGPLAVQVDAALGALWDA